MKYVVNICNVEVVLSAEQFEALVDTLRDTCFLDAKYMGSGKGDNGGNYTQIVIPFSVFEKMQAKPMPDDLFGALELKTKLLNESKS